MDGLTCRVHVLEIRPTPVIMVSTLTTKGTTAAFEALDLGAVDYLAKPDGTVSVSINRGADMLCEKVAAAAKARLRRGRKPETPTPPRAARPLKRAPRILRVGASTGGRAGWNKCFRPTRQLSPADPSLPRHARRLYRDLCPQARGQYRAEGDRGEPAHGPETRPGPFGAGRCRYGAGLRAGQLSAVPMAQDQARAWHPSVGRMVASRVKLVPVEETCVV